MGIKEYRIHNFISVVDKVALEIYSKINTMYLSTLRRGYEIIEGK